MRISALSFMHVMLTTLFYWVVVLLLFKVCFRGWRARTEPTHAKQISDTQIVLGFEEHIPWIPAALITLGPPMLLVLAWLVWA